MLFLKTTSLILPNIYHIIWSIYNIRILHMIYNMPILIIEITYWPALKCWTRRKLIILKLRTVCSSILKLLFIENDYHLHIMPCFGQIIIQKNFKNNIFSMKYHLSSLVQKLAFKVGTIKNGFKKLFWLFYFENTFFSDINFIIFL